MLYAEFKKKSYYGSCQRLPQFVLDQHQKLWLIQFLNMLLIYAYFCLLFHNSILVVSTWTFSMNE